MRGTAWLIEKIHQRFKYKKMNENKMTKEELAAKLNGIEYGRDIPEEYYPVLVENNLAIVLVGSGDFCYFLFPENGKVETKELECWGDTTFWFDRNLKDILDVIDQINREWKTADCKNSIEAVLREKDITAPDGECYEWIYKTEIPHATFDIVEHFEGGGVSYYCRAIIFDINDLK
ncbi:MAG: hypothetical protein LBK07_11840 [Tannerella sp.]|jgi:hypothetical protein|nr:hypothetical protein [Tannerella sp.]